MIPHPPDDPGTSGERVESPLIYGSEIADASPNTIRTIRKNAGRVSPDTIARALCWRLKRLIRVARANHIDLRYPPHENEPEPVGA